MRKTTLFKRKLVFLTHTNELRNSLRKLANLVVSLEYLQYFANKNFSNTEITQNSQNLMIHHTCVFS